MADDAASEYQSILIEEALSARTIHAGESAAECAECGEAIPQARREG